MGWLKDLFKSEPVCDCRNCSYTRKNGGYAPCIKNIDHTKPIIPPPPRPSRSYNAPPKFLGLVVMTPEEWEKLNKGSK